MSNKTALIAGSTGMVGESCLQLLLAEDAYVKVIAPTRSKLQFTHPKLENPIVDFDKPGQYASLFNADHIYCPLGSTIAKAGSQERFRQIDFDMPLSVAKLSLTNGATSFALVSSLGADATSSVFYSKTKGELEDAINKLGFESLFILRPSILLGNRKEKRTGEAVGRWISETLPFLFSGPLKKYRGIQAQTVAQAMVNLSLSNKKGTFVIENEQIFDEAN